MSVQENNENIINNNPNNNINEDTTEIEGDEDLEVIRQWVEDQGLGNRITGASADVIASYNRIYGNRNEEEE